MILAAEASADSENEPHVFSMGKVKIVMRLESSTHVNLCFHVCVKDPFMISSSDLPKVVQTEQNLLFSTKAKSSSAEDLPSGDIFVRLTCSAETRLDD